MEKFTTVLICFMLLSNLEMSGQYLETFDTANKGALQGGCTTPDVSSCTLVDLAGVSWSITGDLNIIEPGSGASFEVNDDFKTVAGVLTTTTGDLDVKVCWLSPLLDISSAGNDVDFSLDISYSDFEESDPDYMDVEYSVDGAAFELVEMNLVGSGGHTITGGTGSQIGLGIPGGISGNTLQIRVCVDVNSTSETFTLDNVSVPDANVTILPIELLSFEAKPIKNQYIQLNWQTATEVNNDYINIQRSADGRDFTTIGKVVGHGTTDLPQDYRFMDKNPLSGTNYYRLQQVDFDGKTTFHRVISIDFHSEEALDIKLNPNPINDILQISLDRELAEATQFAIFDSQGTMISQQIWPAEKRTQSLALSQWPSGIYYLQVIAGNNLYNRKFIKQ